MRMFFIRLAVYLGGLVTIMCAVESSATLRNPELTNYFVYVGTYGKGIYGYRFDAATSKLDPMGLVSEVANPSFLASDNHFRFLYAVSELDGEVNGGVAAFSIDRKHGSLRFLNSTSSGGVAPCHLVVDATAKTLFVANYGTGGISAYPIEHDGRLGVMSALMEAHGSSVDPERQKGPHAHEVVIAAGNRFLYVPDLGLDQIRIYRIDSAHSKLTSNQPPFVKEEAGLGPRHIAFSPNGRFAYVINELKSVITVFSYDASTGDLKLVQTVSTLPPGFSGENAPAEILVDRAGKFLYASNRGDDSIAVFAIDEKTGTLRQIQIVPSRGKEPRGVEIDPTGHFLFVGNHRSDQVVVFRINQKTGELDSTGQMINVATPVAFQFVPAA
ncbi:MAG: lactonase family protein [Acidobacteriaceae bacterium]|nr:lactonase family protein [Acidobacteriaceae bacterium]MBV9780184.1 lactonase family protein [Acidobacteriaceae bacterium]